jgi:hypothetical protein
MRVEAEGGEKPREQKFFEIRKFVIHLPFLLIINYTVLVN